MGIRTGFRWTYKPPLGHQIDWSHPQAAGLRMFHLFNEGGGPPFDMVAKRLATLVGPASWTVGAAGGARSNYSGSNYDTIDPPTQVLGVTYPFWIAFGYSTATTSAQVLGGSGNSGTLTPSVAIWIGTAGPGGAGGSGIIGYFVRDSAGVSGSPSVFNAGTFDGRPHVVAGVSYAANDHRLYFDGIQIAATTTAIGTLTAPLYTLGVHRRNAVTNPFLGTLYWHQAGVGAVPDMGTLAREPFASIQTPAVRRYVPSTAASFLCAPIGGGPLASSTFARGPIQ